MAVSIQSAARIWAAKDLTEAELHPIGKGLAAVFTTRAPGKETVNEDAAAVIPFDESSGILVVADGAGGLPAGARASEIAVNALRNALRQAAKKGTPMRVAVLDGIEQANKEVLALGVGAATTLAVAEVNGDYLRTYHIGDSQIMLIGQRGRLKMQTMSHSPVGYAVEAGIINAREALLHEERHLVSNLLGAPDMRIELGSMTAVAAKDTIVIASDGVFDNLTAEEIVETCRKGSLLSISRNLVEACHRRMTQPKENEPSKPDDLTFIAYRRRVSE